MLTRNIKSLCKQRGISMRELERLCNMPRSSLYRWDAQRPSIDKVVTVADYFCVPLDELMHSDIKTDAETIEFSRQFRELSKPQRELVKCYMSLISSDNRNDSK